VFDYLLRAGKKSSMSSHTKYIFKSAGEGSIREQKYFAIFKKKLKKRGERGVTSRGGKRYEGGSGKGRNSQD